MLANMASSLITHKRISTTLAKAKALRVYVEPLITKSKNDTTHSRRTVFAYLQDKEVVAELFRDVAAKVANRPGGYTRIIQLNNRLGDNAEMAIIELVDYNETYGKDTAAADKKTTRRGRSKAKKADAPAVEVKEEVAVDADSKEDTATVVDAKEEVSAAPVAEEATPDAAATDDAEEKKA